MTNHAYVHAKRINKKETRTVLHEIMKNRFGDHLQISESAYGFHVEKTGDDFDVFLDIKINNHRRIEMRKCHQQIADWIQNVVQSDLARHYDGMLGDEGVEPERWEPEESDKYYSDFIARRCAHAPSAKDAFLSMGVQEVKAYDLEPLFAENIDVFVVMCL